MNENDESEARCLICTDPCQNEDVKTIQFGCGCQYHSQCLFCWYDTIGRNENTSRCPQCRQQVIVWDTLPLKLNRSYITLPRERDSLDLSIWTIFLCCFFGLICLYIRVTISDIHYNATLVMITDISYLSAFSVVFSWYLFKCVFPCLKFIYDNIVYCCHRIINTIVG